MRRVGSYGGPYGVAGSERLKHRLSLTPGLHLISSSSLGESGFLAVVGDSKDERVIHKTFGAARNFYSIPSNLKQVAKRESWVSRKDPFAPVVRETFIFDEPVVSNKDCNSEAPSTIPVLLTNGDGKHCTRPGVEDNCASSGCAEAVSKIPSNDSQVIEEVAASADTPPFRLSDNQAGHLVPDEGHAAGPDGGTEPPCIALAEAEDSLSKSPPFEGQDAQTFLLEKREAETPDNVNNLSHDESLLETSPGLQDTENDRSNGMAAVKIQSCWRGWRQRKGFLQFKDRVVFLQSLVRRNQELRQYHRTLHSLIVLQKYRRAVQSVQAVKRLKTERALREERKINNAAVVVQNNWRSVQSRSLVNRLRKERDVRALKRSYHAAVVVQKHCRGHQARCSVKHLKIERVAVEQQQRAFEGAAVVMQKNWRARRGRCLVKHLRIEQAVKEKERINNAAIVLQKHWRAHQGWCFVKHLKIELAVRERERIVTAATVVQKHWRAKQGRCLVQHLRKEQGLREQQWINDAAVVLQKCWRAQQCKRLLKRLQIEYDIREQQKNDDAAVVLQKHWRALQGRSYVRHLKLEQVVRDQKRKSHAAVVIQKHWRAHQARFLVKRFKKEQAAREKQKIDNAATVLQKHWRALCSRSSVKHLKMELTVKELHRLDQATVVLQKNWRAHQSRGSVERIRKEQLLRQQKMDSASIVLQKHWRARQSMLIVKHLKMENTVQEQQRVDNAATIFQRHWRGKHSRLLISHLKSEQVLRKLQKMDNAAILLQKHWRGFQGRRAVEFLYMEQQAGIGERAAVCIQAHVRGNVARVKLKALTIQHDNQHSLESSASPSIVCHVDGGVQSVDLINSSPDRWQELACGPIGSQEHDLIASQGDDREFSATCVGDVQLQKNEVQEDWNYVAVDQLEECLDTCLAALRPLPSGTQHCLPGLDVPEKSQQFIAAGQNLEGRKNINSSIELSTGTCDIVQQVPGISSDETGNERSDPIGSPSDTSTVQYDQVKSQVAAIDGRDQLEMSSGPLQETRTEQMDKPVQGRSLGRQTLKQNEQRLKQFAQVFLLQRCIALQQQRAQAAPPFPPPIATVGSEVPSQIGTQASQPLEVASGDQGEAAVQSTSLYTDTHPIEVNGNRPKEDHVVCDIVDSNNEQTGMRNASERHDSGAKQIIGRPGPDVVLDMVLLLRQIKEEYGDSEGDMEGDSSAWCTSGCSDMEEGIPLLERNLGSMRRDSSIAKFANAVSIKHISIPDVSAVLLVFIAMVVYTRTVCKGLFFGGRQTHRRP